jgi:hypothetical protein
MRDLRPSTVAAASSEQTMRLQLLLRRLPVGLIGLTSHFRFTPMNGILRAGRHVSKVPSAGIDSETETPIWWR